MRTQPTTTKRAQYTAKQPSSAYWRVEFSGNFGYDHNLILENP